LTSGQSKSAEKGAKTIKKAINKFDDNIKVISAGKILYSNLYDIHQKIGGRYYHGRKILGNLI
jgi:copper homeostasis protein